MNMFHTLWRKRILCYSPPPPVSSLSLSLSRPKKEDLREKREKNSRLQINWKEWLSEKFKWISRRERKMRRGRENKRSSITSWFDPRWLYSFFFIFCFSSFFLISFSYVSCSIHQFCQTTWKSKGSRNHYNCHRKKCLHPMCSRTWYPFTRPLDKRLYSDHDSHESFFSIYFSSSVFSSSSSSYDMMTLCDTVSDVVFSCSSCCVSDANIRLPANHRQKIDGNGTLVIINAQKSDRGNYTCHHHSPGTTSASSAAADIIKGPNSDRIQRPVMLRVIGECCRASLLIPIE